MAGLIPPSTAASNRYAFRGTAGRTSRHDVEGSLKRPLDLFDRVALDDIARAHVLVALEAHAAFLAGHDLAHLVLEALERRKLALVDDHVVAAELARTCIALAERIRAS